jgi:hypothetical protein
MMGHEKEINFNVDGGRGGIDSLVPALLANNGGGLGGGQGGIWALLLVVLLGLGRGCGFGGYGAGAGAVAGAAVASDNGFFQVLNQLNSLSREVSGSAALTNTSVDSSADRVIASNNIQTGFLNTNLAGVQASVSAGNAATTNGFSSLRESLCQSFGTTNTNLFNGFSGLSKEVGCLFNNLNSNLTNQFANLNSNLCNNFNQLYSQNAALNCAIDKLSCQIACNTKETNALIVASTDRILNAKVVTDLQNENAQLRDRLAAANNAAMMNAFNTNQALLTGIAQKTGVMPSMV